MDEFWVSREERGGREGGRWERRPALPRRSPQDITFIPPLVMDWIHGFESRTRLWRRHVEDFYGCV